MNFNFKEFIKFIKPPRKPPNLKHKDGVRKCFLCQEVSSINYFVTDKKSYLGRGYIHKTCDNMRRFMRKYDVSFQETEEFYKLKQKVMNS